MLKCAVNPTLVLFGKEFEPLTLLSPRARFPRAASARTLEPHHGLMM